MLKFLESLWSNGSASEIPLIPHRKEQGVQMGDKAVQAKPKMKNKAIQVDCENLTHYQQSRFFSEKSLLFKELSKYVNCYFNDQQGFFCIDLKGISETHIHQFTDFFDQFYFRQFNLGPVYLWMPDINNSVLYAMKRKPTSDRVWVENSQTIHQGILCKSDDELTDKKLIKFVQDDKLVCAFKIDKAFRTATLISTNEVYSQNLQHANNFYKKIVQNEGLNISHFNKKRLIRLAYNEQEDSFLFLYENMDWDETVKQLDSEDANEEKSYPYRVAIKEKNKYWLEYSLYTYKTYTDGSGAYRFNFSYREPMKNSSFKKLACASSKSDEFVLVTNNNKKVIYKYWNDNPIEKLMEQGFDVSNFDSKAPYITPLNYKKLAPPQSTQQINTIRI